MRQHFYIIPKVRNGQFGLCSLHIFFFFLFFFLFLSVFSLTDTNDSKDSREERGNHHFFFVFHFHPLANIHLVYRDFYHLLLISICNYQTDSWWDLFSLEICILFAFSMMKLSWGSCLWQFKVTLWGFELISN